MQSYYVYILTNQSRGTLYIGVTNNMNRRFMEHLEGGARAFTQKYGLKRLVYFEQTENIEAAIQREKQLKNWHRQWKINLIETLNPHWQDLSQQWGMGPEINSG